jgi:predicted DNA-binding protein
MSLNKRLSKSKDKSDEKVITMRMPQNKVTLLEILSKHYGLTMSTLIRDIIDESIVKLAKEHLVVSEDTGMLIDDESTGETNNIRFFSDIVEHIAPELPVRIKREDFCTDKEFDKAISEEVKLSYEYGFSTTSSWTNPDGEEYVFTKKTKVKK